MLRWRYEAPRGGTGSHTRVQRPRRCRVVDLAQHLPRSVQSSRRRLAGRSPAGRPRRCRRCRPDPGRPMTTTADRSRRCPTRRCRHDVEHPGASLVEPSRGAFHVPHPVEQDERVVELGHLRGSIRTAWYGPFHDPHTCGQNAACTIHAGRAGRSGHQTNRRVRGPRCGAPPRSGLQAPSSGEQELGLQSVAAHRNCSPITTAGPATWAPLRRSASAQAERLPRCARGRPGNDRRRPAGPARRRGGTGQHRGAAAGALIQLARLIDAGRAQCGGVQR